MGLKNDDPRLFDMMKIIQSVEGIKAMVLATNDGHPALAGVDPLLQIALGAEYKREDDVTQEAGWRVVKEMREMGFQDVFATKMPPGCIAGKAMMVKQPQVSTGMVKV